MSLLPQDITTGEAPPRSLTDMLWQFCLDSLPSRPVCSFNFNLNPNLKSWRGGRGWTCWTRFSCCSWKNIFKDKCCWTKYCKSDWKCFFLDGPSGAFYWLCLCQPVVWRSLDTVAMKLFAHRYCRTLLWIINTNISCAAEQNMQCFVDR